jgi:hypothetical protein
VLYFETMSSSYIRFLPGNAACHLLILTSAEHLLHGCSVRSTTLLAFVLSLHPVGSSVSLALVLQILDVTLHLETFVMPWNEASAKVIAEGLRRSAEK